MRAYRCQKPTQANCERGPGDLGSLAGGWTTMPSNVLGSIAFLLTGLAAALRFAPEAFLQKWGLNGFDKGVLLAVLAIYAVMGAISFYEKGTDKTTAYFRHLGIILAIRDLWTKVQFEFLKELMALKSAAGAGEAVTRERIRALAEAFCNIWTKSQPA